MGWHQHHAIVVTGWDEDRMKAAHAKASELFAEYPAVVGSLGDSGMNKYRSFLVAPDGSKEGWGMSNECDAIREEFKDWLRAQETQDDGHYLKWCEVMFGNEYDAPARVLDSHDGNHLPNK